MDISHNTTVPLLDGKSSYHVIKIWLCWDWYSFRYLYV